LPQFGGPEVEKSESKDSKKDVEDTLLSPQFQSALSAFCTAFPSGQLGPLVSQFEMGTEAVTAAQNGNLEAFLNAIQKDADSASPKEEPSSTKPESEDMNVD